MASTNVLIVEDEETRNPVKNLASASLARNSTLASIGGNLLITADGTDIPIEYIASPIADVQGALMGVVLILKDLTSERRVEIESKIRDTAMASSINALCIIDKNGTIKYANAPFYDLWGYEEKDVLGRSASEICQMDAKAYSFVDITNLKGAQEELKKYISKLHRTDVKTDELAEELSNKFKLCYELMFRLYAMLSGDNAHNNDEIAKCLAETKESIDEVAVLVEEMEMCSLPYSLYVSLIALYQLEIEDFGDYSPD